MRRPYLPDYNLLVACPRDRERAAISEIKYFIGDLLGDPDLRVSRTHVSGLIACTISGNPFEMVQSLHEFAVENPYQFRFAIKFTPLERCVESSTSAIQQAAKELLPKIGEEHTFRVTIRKRHSDMDSRNMVVAVAEVIPRRVDLDNPDWTVLVEIVGDWTGVSVLNEDNDVLSIMKMRDDQY